MVTDLDSTIDRKYNLQINSTHQRGPCTHAPSKLDRKPFMKNSHRTTQRYRRLLPLSVGVLVLSFEFLWLLCVLPFSVPAVLRPEKNNRAYKLTEK